MDINKLLSNLRIADKDSYQEYYEKRKKIQIVSTHIGPSLNDLLGGGLRTQQFYILLAGTGVGKSTTMMQLALDCKRAGQKAAYVTIDEQNEFEILERMACMWLKISYHEYIKSPDDYPNVPEFIINNLLESITVYFSRDPFKETTKLNAQNKVVRVPAEFNEILADMKEREINFLFVDYLNAVAIDKDSYSKLAYLSSELKDIAESDNIMIFTAMQTNRELKKAMKQQDFDATLVDESFMADSIGPARKCTTCMSLVKEPNKEYMTLNVFKNRLTGRTGSIKITSEPLSMKLSEICDPELGF